MTLIDREQLLKPVPVPIEDVAVPELGDGATVRLRGMTAGQRTRFEQQFVSNTGKQRNTQTLRERLLIQCVIGADDQPMLTPDDIVAIGQQSSVVIERLVNVAMRLCGMSNNDVESLAGN